MPRVLAAHTGRLAHYARRGAASVECLMESAAVFPCPYGSVVTQAPGSNLETITNQKEVLHGETLAWDAVFLAAHHTRRLTASRKTDWFTD